jgi:hypothetical protein
MCLTFCLQCLPYPKVTTELYRFDKVVKCDESEVAIPAVIDRPRSVLWAIGASWPANNSEYHVPFPIPQSQPLTSSFYVRSGIESSSRQRGRPGWTGS